MDKKIKIKLTLNEEQARVIINALDLYTRINIGQIRAISDVFLFRRKWNWDEFHFYANGLKKTLFPDLQENESYGVHSSKVNESARIAWDIHQVLRHDISWFLNPNGGMTVNFDKPLKTSWHAFPEVEIMEDDTR